MNLDQQEIVFLLLIATVIFVIYSIVGIAEFIYLRFANKLTGSKQFLYPVAANIGGFFATALTAAGLLTLFFVFFAAAMGGSATLASGAMFGGLAVLVLLPISIFVIRLILLKLFKTDKNKIGWKYALVTTFLTSVFVVISTIIVSFILTNLVPNI